MKWRIFFFFGFKVVSGRLAGRFMFRLELGLGVGRGPGAVFVVHTHTSCEQKISPECNAGSTGLRVRNTYIQLQRLTAACIME
jgi:hypothetical protein